MNKVLVRSHKEEYRAGEDVCGVVYLHIEEPTAGRGITITFKGHEHFQYEYKSSEGCHKFDATKDYIDYHANLYSNTDPFAIGNFAFPFKIALPKVIPCSFETQTNGDATWKSIIKYSLRASVVDTGLEDTQNIFVIPNINEPEGTASNVEQVIRKFPFMKSINFTVRLVDASPRSGENLKLRLIITNTSSVTIDAFSIKLLRNLVFICKTKIPVNSLSTPNVTQHGQRTYIQAESETMVVREIKGKTSGLKNKALDRVMDNLLIPLSSMDGNALPPSTSGQHIQCSYKLEIRLSLSNKSDVILCHKIPAILGRKNTQWHVWKPPNWICSAKVVLSDCRLSVSKDEANGERFSGFPGFQAL